MEIMEELGDQIEAWGPFAKGQQNIFENKTLVKIGKKYDKTPAQVMLRWNIVRGAIVIPKSVHKSRIRENFDIWDFDLTQDDMNTIAEWTSAVMSYWTEVSRIYNEAMEIKEDELI